MKDLGGLQGPEGHVYQAWEKRKVQPRTHEGRLSCPVSGATCQVTHLTTPVDLLPHTKYQIFLPIDPPTNIPSGTYGPFQLRTQASTDPHTPTYDESTAFG